MAENNEENIVVSSNNNTKNESLCDEMKSSFKVAMPQSIMEKFPAELTVTERKTNKKQTIILNKLTESASGCFGTVFEGTLKNGLSIAIKRVIQDPRYKNRELEIMLGLSHENITTLLYYFFTVQNDDNQICLNIIMEFVPQTISRICKFYSKSKSFLPTNFVKLYIYQLFRAINYLHKKGVCHRDIKPQNVLINPSKGLLRICDFGSAKKLVKNEPNVAYICSRYYRAPELIFGATNYTNNIDIWSVGCVFAEVMLNSPIFPGDSSVDQMVEVIKIMGTPSKQEIHSMNPNYKEFNFPQIKGVDLSQMFKSESASNQAIDLLKKTLVYTPGNRISPLDAMAHGFFDELRTEAFLEEHRNKMPKLSDFTAEELKDASNEIKAKLTKSHK